MPWALTLGLLVGLGLVLRVVAFDVPAGFLFDEHHFVENARNYLAHRADWNDHPPLGKLFIALSIRLLGDGPVGWRMPALLFGLLTVALGGVTVARLFRSREAGAVAAALLSADGFLIAYSRAGLLDGVLAASLVLALFCSTLRPSARVAVAAGALLGCAMNVKFSGVGVALPLLVWLLLDERAWSRRLALGGVVGVVAASTYLGLYAAGLALAGQPTGVSAAVRETQRLLAHHAALTDMKHPLTSGWVTWFLPQRAIVMSWIDSMGTVRALSMLGNLATWWGAGLCAAAATWNIAVLGLRRVLKPVTAAPEPVPPSEGVDATAATASPEGPVARFVLSHGRAAVLLLAGALGFLAPWAVSHRDSYLYHYLPSYTALVMLLGGFVSWLRARSPGLALGFVCVVLVVAAVYAPLWSSLPLSAEGARARLFLQGWR
jgi:dolichyl-phosphate-mannose-protein mannosyltransferase